MRAEPSPTRSRTRGQRTATGPMPVRISRSGRCPWRTSRWRPSSCRMPGQQGCYLGLDGLRQQCSRTIAQHLGQRVRKSSWLGEMENVIVGHGVSLLRWKSGGVKHPHDTPPYPLRASPTFAHSSTNLGYPTIFSLMKSSLYFPMSIPSFSTWSIKLFSALTTSAGLIAAPGKIISSSRKAFFSIFGTFFPRLRSISRYARVSRGSFFGPLVKMGVTVYSHSVMISRSRAPLAYASVRPLNPEPVTLSPKHSSHSNSSNLVFILYSFDCFLRCSSSRHHFTSWLTHQTGEQSNLLPSQFEPTADSN